MQRKKTSGAGVSSQQTIASSNQLDFSSPKFNCLDDLDDNTGNYRAFQSLAGIVTSDMRHQEMRQKMPSPPIVSQAERAEGIEPESGISEARQVTVPPSLTIVSRGRLLIIDSDLERALTCAERLSEMGIDCTLCTPMSRGNAGFSATRLDSFAFIEADSISVTGCFGGFVPTVKEMDGTGTDQSSLTGLLSSVAGQIAGSFDLILDLQTTPSFAGQQLPVGYYAPGEDPVLLEAAMVELPEMRGRFQKPQFIVMMENCCLHGRSRFDDCRRCVDICPVAALSAQSHMIVIDQYRCQGCGACALVCPTDAIHLPGARKELFSELHRLVSGSIAVSPTSFQVVFYDQYGDEAEDTLPVQMERGGSRRLFFAVEEIGRIGLDVLLATLAYGATSVALVCDATRPAAIREALEQQARFGSVLVQGLQMPAECLSFSGRTDELPDAPEQVSQSLASPAGFTFDHDKRTLTRLAAEHLFPQNCTHQPVIELPAGAPFGTIAVSASCSLCMACVGACPAGALVADGVVPKLSLIESRCHQCGLCMAVCPENCLTLQPRLLCDTLAAESLTVLYEAEPFKCVECGEPFASVTMVSRMQEKLAGHWMYSSTSQARRLQMCSTCRTRDVFTAGDYRK